MTGRLLAAAAALLLLGTVPGAADAQTYCYRAYPGGPFVDVYGRPCNGVRPPTLVEPTIVEQTVIEPVIIGQAPPYGGAAVAPYHYYPYAYAAPVIVVVPRARHPHHHHPRHVVVVRQAGQALVVRPQYGAARAIPSHR